MPCSRAWLGALLLACAPLAQAHKSSDAYLQLRGGAGTALSLRADVALRDLDVVLDLDTDGDGRLSWGEVRAAWPAIEAYLVQHLVLQGCVLPSATRSLERRVDGVYAALQWQTDCRPEQAPSIHYSLMAEADPTHRGLARVEWAGQPPVLQVLVPRVETAQLSSAVPAPVPAAASAASPAIGPVAAASQTQPAPVRADAPGPSASQPLQFLLEGVRHILTGYDHVLFLICLLLPSVMRRTVQGWQAVDRPSQALWPVAAIVTAFTVAHTVTLAMAATGRVSLPPGLIEPAIALTIMLAAFDNLRSIFHGRRVFVTFAFGLIHGFGFASVLAELNLPAAQFAWALLQFNLGLELGQLLIVGAVVTLLYGLRHAAYYPRWVIGGGSVLALLTGGVWLVERTANIALLRL